MPIKEATSLCKTILRNGYDAYIINTSLQSQLHDMTGLKELDIACELDFETLGKLFPNLVRGAEEEVIGTLLSEETGILYRFYPQTSAMRPIPRWWCAASPRTCRRPCAPPRRKHTARSCA